jgi:transcriptional regulator with XRE-family HTH domain
MSNQIKSFSSSFGARLKEARKNAGLTQEGLADEISIAKDTLSRYERGSMTPGAEVLLNLADAVDVDVRWLLTGEKAYLDEEEEPTPQERKSTRSFTLKSFGCVNELKMRGGHLSAQVLLGYPEVTRLLDALSKEEELIENGNQEIASSLKLLKDYFSGAPINIQLIAPIGSHSIKLVPEVYWDILQDDELKSED